jgi:hypothetical protein
LRFMETSRVMMSGFEKTESMPPSSWPELFVGREKEIENLEAMIDGAKVHGGRLILLRGEKGVGKTRLAGELAVRAAMRGSRVLWGRWEKSPQSRLRVFGADLQDQGALTLLSHVVATPEARPPLGSYSQREVLAANGLPSPDHSFEPESTLSDSHSPECGNGRRCLFLIDDLHPSDRRSLALLGTLIGELRTLPCAILAIYEGTQNLSGEDFDTILGNAKDKISSIELRGLNEDDVDRLVTTVLGQPAEPSLVETIYSVSRGHPAVVKQIASLVRARMVGPSAARELTAANKSTTRLSSHEDVYLPEDRAVGAGKWLTREADYWTLRLRARVVRLRHMKGLTYINYLMDRPGTAVHSQELAALERATSDRAEPKTLDLQDANGVTLRGDIQDDAGPALDWRAKEAYGRRLRELGEELEEAMRFNDLGRMASLREEHAFITHELSRAVGLRGRDRKGLSLGERARVSVTHAIKFVIHRIGKEEPELGRRLSAAIRTGLYCSFESELMDESPWQQPGARLACGVA